MPAPVAKPASRRHPGEVIRGAEVFASGNYRGKPYTVRHIEQMAENFTRLPYLDPPAVLGHEETQEFLDRTDLPAAGWVSRVWVHKYYEPATRQIEAVLKADIEGVAPAVARLIRAKRYRKISAEVYDDFRDDFGRTHGRALRRVAFLGAEVPQVKRIADIPMPTAFGESGRRTPLSRRRSPLRPLSATRTDRGTYLCFAEPTPMDRQQTIQAILAALPGIMPATLDAMSDDQLADLAKNLSGGAAPAGTTTQTPAAPAAGGATPFAEGDPPPEGGDDAVAAMSREELIEAITAAGEDPAGLDEMSDEDLRELYRGIMEGGKEPPPQPVETMGDPAVMSREELIAELTAAGQDPAQLEGLTDDDLRAMYAQVVGAGAAPPPAPAAPPAQPVAAMSEEMRRFSKLATDARAEIQRNLHKSRVQEVAARRNRIVSFCELMVRQGKILSGEKAIYVRNLLRCDDSNAVVKFADAKGVVRVGTVLDQEMDAIRRKPAVVKFGERLPTPAGHTPGGASPTRDLNQVIKFAEQVYQGQPELKEQFVNNYVEMKKQKPTLTPQDVGVPAHPIKVR